MMSQDSVKFIVLVAFLVCALSIILFLVCGCIVLAYKKNRINEAKKKAEAESKVRRRLDPRRTSTSVEHVRADGDGDPTEETLTNMAMVQTEHLHYHDDVWCGLEV